MLDAKDLIKGKLARIATSDDEPCLAFVTTLLSCGGRSFVEYGYPRGFSDYRTLWGEDKFKQMKEGLVQEGLLSETQRLKPLGCLAWRGL